MTNLEIAKLLRNIAAAYTIKDEQKFRFQIIAYQRAADAIEHSTTEVKDLYSQDKLESIPGVGPSIQGHLEELVKTGKVKHFEWVTKDIPESVFPLLEVPTFGPKKAFKLVTEFKLSNPKTIIQDIEKIAKQGKIAPLVGFGEKSQADIIRAINEFKKGSGKTTRMALPFAAELAEKMLDYVRKSKDVLKAYPLGSLRRNVSTVGDIDIAISTHNPNLAIDYFTKYPLTQRVIEKGDVSASLLTTAGKQIDLIALKPTQLGSLLQHFTGSKNHNVHLREYALKKGLSLSERGIKFKGSEKIKEFDTEEKFYEALGMQWIPPEMREDTGEIELALQKKLPKLVELTDIKGDLHIHSSFPIEPSHDMGLNSMQDLVKRAIELKYEYIGFSEHNPSVSKHTKEQIYSLLAKKKEAIEKLQEKYKHIKIFNLLELDILTNGDLAIDDKALDTLDAVLVSIHSVFSMDKKTMTKRVLQGLSHPKAKILSHPTGRLLNIRPGYELDYEQIFEFCKKNDKALEINSWPTRLDLPDIIVREAVISGVSMTIDTDSHATEQMYMMKYGVSVARRGWATKNNIVNTKNANEFEKWLKPSYAKATEGKGGEK